MYKTCDGKALFDYRFINGKKIKTLIRNRTKSAKKRKSPGTLEQVCTTYFYLEYTENCYYSDPESDWMTCTLTIDYYTEWTECVDNDDYYDNLTGDDCVDYGIGCPEDPTPTPTPNPDPCYNATSYTKNGTRILTGCDIENDVDNACLKSVVQTVVNNNIEFDVNRTLNSIFGTNDDVNLYFHDEELQSGIDGEARKRYDYSTNGVRQLGIDINLNQKTLPNASKEYIVATILHESLHAYFRVQNQTASLDHDEMANKYINWFKDIMDDYFPNISSTDNNALAWEGLGETKAWEKKSSEEKNSIAAINGKHRALTSGTPPCP